LSRSERLLDLIQLLRRHRHPVTGGAIAAELGISARTLYRDIATLQAQGAPIDGAPGLGYVLRDGFTLPPLMFSTDEVEALVLGMRWVADRGDAPLRAAARDVAAKIAAVLPAPLRREMEANALLVGPGRPNTLNEDDSAAIRHAIRHEHKLHIAYSDAEGKPSQRTIWPAALGYFDAARVVVAWCELRESIRHFRTDRISGLRATDQRYPQRRHALLALWRAQEGLGRP